MKIIQKTLNEFIKELPEDTFLWHWIRFCESIYPKIVKKNIHAFFVTGLSLINIVHRAYVQRNKPMPANFYIALYGKPAAGKGRVLDCLRSVIKDTWIAEIPTGSAEALELGIHENKYGFLIWDEMGEIVEKSGDYLHRVKYVLNRAYYLDPIMRKKTTKKSVIIPAHSYYLNVIFAGLEEDWIAIEKRFLGGFERRFIRIKMERARMPFEEEEINPEGWKHAFWLLDYIKDRAGEVWYVKTPSLEALRNTVMQVEEKYWSAMEEYAYKVATALLLNIAKGQEGQVQGIKVSKVSKVSSIDIQYMIPNDTYDTLYYMIPFDTMIPSNSSDFLSGHKNENHFDSMIPSYEQFSQEDALSVIKGYLCDTIDVLIRHLYYKHDIADETILRIINRIEELKKDPKDPGFMVKKRFVREVLRTTNAQYYQYVLSALEDAEIIKAINGSIFGKKGVLIVYDLKKRICANCEHLKVCAANAQREKRVLDICRAMECPNFRLSD